MPEAQQGPEILDKALLFPILFFENTVGASVGEGEVFDWAKNFFQTYPCDRILFSIFLWCM